MAATGNDHVPRSRRPVPSLAAFCLALLGGLLVACAFAPVDVPICPLPGLWCLLVATRGQRLSRASWLGLVFALAYLAVLLSWNRIVGWDGWVAVVVLESVFVWLVGPAWALAQRTRLWPVLCAATWVGVESVRSVVPFGGFPWGRLAFATVDGPYAALGRLGGTSLVGFCVVLSVCALAALATAVVTRRAVASLVWAAVAVVPLVVGVLVPGDVAGPTGRMLDVAVVQGGVPGDGLDPFAEQRVVLHNHARTTHRLAREVRAGAGPRPDLVVWPENSTDIDPYADPSAHAEIDAAVRDVGVPVLVGAVVDTPDPQHVKNMGILWSPRSGPGQTYVKRHPVPFGEYLPFRDFLSRHIERFQQVARDFVQGQRVGTLDVGEVVVGDLICFEVAYDGLTQDLVEESAQVIVVQTNNATWARQYPSQLEQQFQMSRYRAIESGRWVVVASTNGISGVVAPDGTVRHLTDVDRTQVLQATVALGSGVTWGVRLGWWTQWLITLGGVLGLVATLARYRRATAAEEDR